MGEFNVTEKELNDLALAIGYRVWKTVPEISGTLEAKNWVQEQAQTELDGFLKKKLEEEK